MSNTITSMTPEKKQLRDANINSAFESSRASSTKINDGSISSAKSIADGQNQFFQQNNELLRNTQNLADTIFK